MKWKTHTPHTQRENTIKTYWMELTTEVWFVVIIAFNNSTVMHEHKNPMKTISSIIHLIIVLKLCACGYTRVSIDTPSSRKKDDVRWKTIIRLYKRVWFQFSCWISFVNISRADIHRIHIVKLLFTFIFHVLRFYYNVELIKWWWFDHWNWIMLL